MARIIEAFSQFFDDNGNPLIDGFLAFKESGTNNTDKDTFADINQLIGNTNPVTLDGAGRCPNIFGSGAYNVISYTSDMQQIQQFDPVSAEEFPGAFSEWNSAVIYGENDIIIASDDKYYRSITNNNQNNEPSASASDWEEVWLGRIVNSMADLRLASTIFAGNITVNGYYGVGDGGGGEFYWDATSTATDNGGTIIKATAITTGRWLRLYSGEINVRWFGATGDGLTDDTAAIQACIDFCFPLRRVVYMPEGTYLVTTTLTVSEGTQIKGDTYFQYFAGFAVPVKATTIDFNPTAPLSLFEYAATPAHGSFRFHTAIQGLHIEGTSVSGGDSNSLIGLDLNGIIYGKFEDLSINGFMTAIACTSTINNRFANILASGVTQCVLYAGTATSDVWNQCTLWGSLVGVSMPSSCIAIRFTDCLAEQIKNYGFDISRKCENITVTNLYAEDVPYDTGAADAAVFRVGALGSGAASIVNHLIVTGGHITGRNAGLHGSVFDVDYCEGIQASNFNASRYVNVIKTSANTRINSITLGGYSGISWTNNITDLTKVTGMYANGVINSGNYKQNATYSGVSADVVTGATVSVTSGLFTDNVIFPATQVPDADPNRLDDYEEGTFTGALVCGTSGTIALYASWETGAYTKVGDKVTVSGFFRAETVSAPVGSLTLTGLPFTARATSDGSSAATIRTLALAAGATTSIQGLVTAATSAIVITKFAAGVNGALAGDVAVNSGFYINATYFV